MSQPDNRTATIKVFENGKVVHRYQSKKISRFGAKLGLMNFLKGQIKVYIKVSYGPKKNQYGKMEEFYNDGAYTNKRDLLKAYRAFIAER